jgi:hypothetical protein
MIRGGALPKNAKCIDGPSVMASDRPMGLPKGLGRHFLVASAALWTVIAPARARAIVIEDKVDNFQLRFEPQNTKLCILLPAELTDPATCKDFDVATLRQGFGKTEGVSHAFTVMRNGTSYVVVRTRTDPMPTPTPRTMAAWSKGFLDAAQKTSGATHTVTPKRPPPHAELLHYGEVSVLRLDVSFEPKPGSKAQRVDNASYAIAGDAACHLVTVIATPDVIEQAKADVETALATMKLAPAKSAEYRMGYLVGRLFGGVIGAMGAIAILVLVPLMLIKRSKRKAGAVP